MVVREVSKVVVDKLVSKVETVVMGKEGDQLTMVMMIAEGGG